MTLIEKGADEINCVINLNHVINEKYELIEEEAKQKVLTAQAEAESMRIRSQAISQNQNLIQYEAVQRWDGKLPVNIYGSAPIPFINAVN